MKLFFIACIHPDDLEMNLDLFVWAEDKNQAAGLWRDWIEREFDVPRDTPYERMFVVPAVLTHFEPQAKILEWHKDVVKA
jgi:hypothetical protein